jgi:hypothetical protein
MGILHFSDIQQTDFMIQYFEQGTTGSYESPLIVQGILNLDNFYPAALSK